MRKLLLLLAAACITGALTAQSQTGYQLPPKDITDLLLAKPTPAVSLDRKGEWLLLSQRNSYPSVEELPSRNYALPVSVLTPITMR